MLVRFVRRALLALLLIPTFAAAQAPAGPAPVEGEDYQLIENGTPYAATKGRIEVVEVFGYVCPHCARFEPRFTEWAAKQPKDVQVVRLAAPWGGHWQPYARAFYAAEALGVLGKTHDAVFRALHQDGSLPLRNATATEIASFYAGYGVNPERLIAAMEGDAVEAAMARAQAFMLRSGIEATPTVVVAGKYRITARSPQDVLRVADHLIARERARR
ncbi:MAG TPA: thiol:disulfide interchange protein DsbA/DsbL [Lysobacter sp.]|nr:thiol:disulfide interchange protein DsbA/DsbL [Lysobacter sp.]